MSRRVRGILVASFLAAGSCAGPPLQLYTLGGQNQEAPPPAGQSRLPVVYVERIAVPDYLDTEDILVRKGHILRRSSRGRLATRLSVGASDLVRARLAARYPSRLITGQAPFQEPATRLLITITRLDVKDDGSATLVADWTIIPESAHSATRRGRASLSVKGSAGSDRDVVSLEQELLLRLADRILLPESSVRSSGRRHVRTIAGNASR